MKRLLALILALLILTLTGCNAADNTSSDIDTNSSEIVSSTDESSADSDTSSEKTVSTETSSEANSSQIATPSKTENTSNPTVSNNVENSSSNQTNSTNKTESESNNQNSVAKNENTSTPTHSDNENTTKTIVLYQKTTYYGQPGYFALTSEMSQTTSEIRAKMISMGLVDEDDLWAGCCSEFYNVKTDEIIIFMFNANFCSTSEMLNYVDENGGRAQIPVYVTE